MSDDENVVDAAALGSWLGVHARRVRALAERGIAERAGRGRYRLRESVAAYIQHLREVAAGRGPAAGAGGPDLVAERARLARAQALAAEMKNDIALGRVVLVEDVALVFAEEYRALRDFLRALPSQVAPRLARLKTAMEIRATLLDSIDEALTDFCDNGRKKLNLKDELVP
jgi:phage terminase Nu1 subunit (DNA packaging protein)